MYKIKHKIMKPILPKIELTWQDEKLTKDVIDSLAKEIRLTFPDVYVGVVSSSDDDTKMIIRIDANLTGQIYCTHITTKIIQLISYL